jgi:hypothetical protein
VKEPLGHAAKTPHADKTLNISHDPAVFNVVAKIHRNSIFLQVQKQPPCRNWDVTQGHSLKVQTDLPRGYWDSYLIVGKAPAPQRGKTLVTFAEAKARISISIGVQALAFSVRLENVNSLKALSISISANQLYPEWQKRAKHLNLKKRYIFIVVSISQIAALRALKVCFFCVPDTPTAYDLKLSLAV